LYHIGIKHWKNQSNEPGCSLTPSINHLAYVVTRKSY
jgi:hypothetical protein